VDNVDNLVDKYGFYAEKAILPPYN